jgi:hypothetical protein
MESGGKRVGDEEHVEGADTFGNCPGVATREVKARVRRRGSAHGLESRYLWDPLQNRPLERCQVTRDS